MSPPAPGPDPAAVEKAARLLLRAESALFITGAGISADSGLPTYRGVGGLYEAETTEEGLPIEVLLSGEVMRARPEWTWKYIGAIEKACRGARPNRAHEVLAHLEERVPRTLVLTQNVDGLHRAAGTRELIAIHGDIHELRCVSCSFRRTVPDYAGLEAPPRCPRCRRLVRPDVVLFGEMLPEDAVERLHAELRRGFDVVFSIGTTSVFPYIAGPFLEARERGRETVEVNPGRTEVSHAATVRIASGAAVALDAVFAAYDRLAAGSV